MDAPTSGPKRKATLSSGGTVVRLLLVLLLGGGLGLGLHIVHQISRGHDPLRDLWSLVLDGQAPDFSALFSSSSGHRTLSLVVPQPDYPDVMEPEVIPDPPDLSIPPAARTESPPAAAPIPMSAAKPAAAPPAPTAPQPAVEAPPPGPPPAVMSPLVLSATMPVSRDSKQVPTLATPGDFSSSGRPPQPLTAAPQADMVMTTADGLTLPTKAPDGRAPWQAYAAPPVSPLPPARLALIFTDLGLEQDTSAAIAARFPSDVAMAFTPYGGVLDRQIKLARERGHEVFLSLPVEQTGYPARDPGPFGLLVAARDDENLARMAQSLSRMQGYVGVIAEDGPFLRSKQMILVLKSLEEYGLGYLSTDIADAPAALPRLQVTDDLPAGQFRESIQEQLDHALKRAQVEKQAVVVVPATPLALQVAGNWLKTLPKRGVTLVPPSSLFRRGSSPNS